MNAPASTAPAYAIAAAGTGGHVFPGLAVGEALVRAGVPRQQVVYFGGDRLEKQVYPAAGYPFVELPLAGLKRSLTLENLKIPSVVWRATARATEELRERGVVAVLGMGSYVTVPVGWAARRCDARFYTHEANYDLGLANRVMARYATTTFTSFAGTEALRSMHSGNPIRADLASFDRGSLRPTAISRYGLDPHRPVVGVVGGSLGAAAINEAVATMATSGDGSLQIVHLVGRDHVDALARRAETAPMPWKVVAFEERMDLFYAACDLVVARSGGMVAELMATGTPAILVPGSFGAAGHQRTNAEAVADAGAARILEEGALGDLRSVVGELAADGEALQRMAAAARSASKPEAADIIARMLVGETSAERPTPDQQHPLRNADSDG